MAIADYGTIVFVDGIRQTCAELCTVSEIKRTYKFTEYMGDAYFGIGFYKASIFIVIDGVVVREYKSGTLWSGKRFRPLVIHTDVCDVEIKSYSGYSDRLFVRFKLGKHTWTAFTGYGVSAKYGMYKWAVKRSPREFRKIRWMLNMSDMITECGRMYGMGISPFDGLSGCGYDDINRVMWSICGDIMRW